MLLETPEWFLTDGSTPIPIASKRNRACCPCIKPTPNAPSPPDGEPKFQGRLTPVHILCLICLHTSADAIAWPPVKLLCHWLLLERLRRKIIAFLARHHGANLDYFLGPPLEKLHKLLHCPMPVKMSVRAITFSLFPLASYLGSLLAVANVTSKDSWYTPK